MKVRKLTVTLTEAQFHALADAIATRDAEDERERLTPRMRGYAEARGNAWAKLKRAWYDR